MKSNTLQTKANNKGFTLVEIIVVLVILAVLAAFTIPAMLGFVEDARGKAHIGEAREIYTAMQAAITEVGSQATTGNPLTATQYKYYIGNANNVLYYKIAPQDATPEDNKIDSDIGNKALELLNNDVLMNNDRKNYAYIYVDISKKSVTKVEYHIDDYIITLDIEHGTTDVVKN